MDKKIVFAGKAFEVVEALQKEVKRCKSIAGEDITLATYIRFREHEEVVKKQFAKE